MICYKCNKASKCSVFRKLYSMSNDFVINQCEDYNELPHNTYKKIAMYDDLMHLIYDYFTEQLEGVSEKEARKAITSCMWDL